MAIGGKLKRRFGRVGVLMGGPSTERKVSLKSGQAIYEAILESGMEVVSVDIKTDKRQENIRLIRSKRIESAFVALHGRFGEDG
ncbi:MAG: D-alanine--D-alanine ligase, partial [Candidatus Omnitrophica bacterium]|nr:D-alanine--D-alanine ligase [Candidatus Omnitrophota bacterium]